MSEDDVIDAKQEGSDRDDDAKQEGLDGDAKQEGLAGYGAPREKKDWTCPPLVQALCEFMEEEKGLLWQINHLGFPEGNDNESDDTNERDDKKSSAASSASSSRSRPDLDSALPVPCQ